MKKELYIRADLRPAQAHATAITIYRRDVQTGGVEYPEIVWKPVSKGSEFPSAFLIDEYDTRTLLTLSDDLNRLGMRSREDQNKDGEIAAMKKHIEDLRTITLRVIKE